jgi:uncharacterized protein (DUF1330 family)
MPAYILIRPRHLTSGTPGMREYDTHIQGTMQPYGGRYRRVRTAAGSARGDSHPPALGIFEFPSFKQAKAWYDGPE